ncbi:MAG: hypothetical protein FJ257_02205 [Phycisphaerae bacterium]|nr:hypothetical protein [Phycisphaerae bacterium]
MPCLLAILGVFFPRVVLAILFLFTNYLGAAFGTWVWPLLGFFLLPFTTLAAAVAWNELGGATPAGVVLIVLGALLDLGAVGGAAKSRRVVRVRD